ncbi:MAG: cob(I)yrinic acid a,c-diamide adenosyltransferase, partial [Candidatus Aminicenantes bacterium]|nr:cob(I)yrinic acid a,c-diamide adenosyltransferase [Candidatus Aminicenantes bacterium]
TSLFSGERVSKDNIIVEAYGTMDELNSFLGDAKHYCGTDGFKEIIVSVQIDLFRLCAELASSSGLVKDPMIGDDVDRMTEILNNMEKKMDLKGFVIPGNTPGSAKLDICRSVTRRGERRIVSLTKKNEVNEFLIKYVNRLSDLLFIMARLEEKNSLYVKKRNQE